MEIKRDDGLHLLRVFVGMGDVIDCLDEIPPDEMPTPHFDGISHRRTTARINLAGLLLGFQFRQFLF